MFTIKVIALFALFAGAVAAFAPNEPDAVVKPPPPAVELTPEQRNLIAHPPNVDMSWLGGAFR